ncbi:MAG: hypothetical protein JXC32_06025 [Anaerolineae bacterium]|nr:hypothetical protein [Anaerolineae bacterium]
MTDDREYHAFLLRLWRTTDRGRAVWRASLEVPGEATRHSFASFPDLVRFLAAQIHQPMPGRLRDAVTADEDPPSVPT